MTPRSSLFKEGNGKKDNCGQIIQKSVHLFFSFLFSPSFLVSAELVGLVWFYSFSQPDVEPQTLKRKLFKRGKGRKRVKLVVLSKKKTELISSVVMFCDFINFLNTNYERMIVFPVNWIASIAYRSGLQFKFKKNKTAFSIFDLSPPGNNYYQYSLDCSVLGCFTRFWEMFHFRSNYMHIRLHDSKRGRKRESETWCTYCVSYAIHNCSTMVGHCMRCDYVVRRSLATCLWSLNWDLYGNERGLLCVGLSVCHIEK